MDHTAAVDIEAVAVFQEEASQAEDIQEAATEEDSQEVLRVDSQAVLQADFRAETDLHLPHLITEAFTALTSAEDGTDPIMVVAGTDAATVAAVAPVGCHS